MTMNGKVFFLQTAWTCFHGQSQILAPATQYQLNHLCKEIVKTKNILFPLSIDPQSYPSQNTFYSGGISVSY